MNFFIVIRFYLLLFWGRQSVKIAYLFLLIKFVFVYLLCQKDGYGGIYYLTLFIDQHFFLRTVNSIY